MNEIKCPKCNHFFKIYDSGFADIVKQVRDREFEKELRERESLMERERENAIKLAEAKTKNETQERKKYWDKENFEGIREKWFSFAGI